MNTDNKGKRILILGFAFSVIFLFMLSLMFLTLNTNGQQRGILFADRNDYFMDFFNSVNHVVGRTPYTWGEAKDRGYAPLAYMLIWPFTFWFDYETNGSFAAREDQLGMFSYVLFFTMAMYLFYAVINKSIKQKDFEKNTLLISFLCSAPMIFNYDRANLTIVAASALFFYLEFYQSDNKLLRHGAYLALAVAAALKLFPAVFGVLLLYDKRWKDALIVTGYGLIVFFVPFLLFHGGFSNILLWFHCAQVHAEAYTFGGSYGLITHTILNSNIAVLIQKYLGYPLLVISLVAGIFLKENWKKVLLITCAILLTSGLQAYYCGIYLIYPIVLFFNQCELKKEHIIFTVLFVIIMAPFRYSFSLPASTVLAESISTREVQNMCLDLIYLYLIAQGIVCMVRYGMERKGEQNV